MRRNYGLIHSGHLVSVSRVPEPFTRVGGKAMNGNLRHYEPAGGGILESSASSASLPNSGSTSVELHHECDCYVGQFEGHILGLNRPHDRGLIGQ
jgi:hypothetical protein